MTDDGKTRQELVAELAAARRRVAELEAGLPRPAEATPDERIALHLDDGETRFRQVFDNMADGLALYQAVDDGADFIFVDHNAAGRRLGGLAPGEELGRRLTEVFPGVERFGLLEALRRVWRTGEPERLPLRAYEDERIVQWVENYIFRMPSGLVAALYSDTSVQRRAEEGLRESERSLRSLFDAIDESVCLFDRQGCILMANATFAARVERSVEDCIGRSIYDLIPPDVATAQRAIIENIPRTGRPVVFEDERLGRWLRHSLCPVVGPDGMVERVALFAVDLTERKQAEEALRHSEAFIRAVMENLPLGIAVNSVDPDVVFSYMNENFPRLYRTTRQALTDPDAFWDTVYEDPDFRREIKARVLADCASNDPERMRWDDVPITRAGLETTYVSARNIPVPDRKIMISVVWDITERKRTEDALRRSEAFHRTLVEAIPDLVWLKDPDGVYLSVNRPFERFMGRAGADILGHDDYDFFDRDLADFFRGNDKKAVETNAPHINEEWLDFVADGYHGLFETIKSPMRDASGRLIGVLGIARDITARRRAEEALRESEERYRLLFDQSLDAIAIQEGLPPVFTWVNPAFCDLGGYTAQEIYALKPEDIWSLVHPEDRDTVRQSLTRRLTGASDGVRYSFRILRKDGGVRWVDVTGRPMRHGGRPMNMSIYRDVTERRRAEDALRDREEHYRRVVEAIQETLTVVRPDGTFLFANARAARNFGLSPEDMIGKNVGNLVPADEAEALAAAYARVAAGTGALRREIKVSMPGGPKWFLNTLMPIRYGHGASVLSLSLDITGRKAIEETLTFLVERPWRDRGEDFFQALARYLAETLDMDFVCVDRLDGDGLTAHTLAVWHDGQFEDNVSYTLKDTPCGDVVGKVVCCFPEGVARRFPDDRILQDIRGESYVGVTLWDASGTPVGLIAVIGRRPLTDPAMAESIMRLASMSAAGELERLLSEEALIKAKERAESASRTKSEFLANMSHEIRTPLNGVLGMLQLLMTTPVSDEQKEYALAAIRSASRLTRLLSDILDLSRIEAGKLAVLNDAVFSPAELMASVRELFATTAASKDLDLVVNLDPDAPTRLFGDEARLRQVLFNLVGNAIKFTEHGRVEVAASLVSPPGASPSRILFSVSDTGVGIPEDRLGDIFEPFTQVDGSYVRRHQGAGLGLAIVRRLVGLMGGDISIESAVGIGTSVHAVIPLRPSAETPPSDVKPRLLLVEDEAVNRLSMKQLLVKSGYDVTTAENGLEALRACRAERFDCVLMDIQMPVMDGLEATRRIRGDLDLAVNPAVPVIAMTAYAMSGDREKFLSAGLDGYIAKPIEIAELVHLVDKLLGRPTGTGPGGDGPAG